MRSSGAQPPLQALVGTLALLALGLMPASAVPGRAGRALHAAHDDGPNAHDYEQIERGYYERLIQPPRRDDPAADRASKPFDAGELAIVVDDVREYVLKPSLTATHRGASWTTNRLGMRDREYQTPKPPGTFRVALAGDSIAAGWGVDDGLGFEPTLERIWTARLDPAGQGGRRVEVLNFAVPGHAPGQRWEHLARVGWETRPDLVVFEGTLADLGWDERRIRVLAPQGRGLDAPVYRDELARAFADVKGFPTAEQVKTRLKPRREAILAGVYRRAVVDCHAHGVSAVWVILPRVGKAASPEDRAKLRSLAESAGFDAAIDLAGLFDGEPPARLAISGGDFHPNVEGHARIAAAIDAGLWDFVSAAAARSRTTEVRLPGSNAAGTEGDGPR